MRNSTALLTRNTLAIVAARRGRFRSLGNLPHTSPTRTQLRNETTREIMRPIVERKPGKGANLGLGQNRGGLEAGRAPTQSSYRSIGGHKFLGRWDWEECRSFTPGRFEGKEAWRHHPGGAKALVRGDEEAVGGAKKDGFVGLHRENPASSATPLSEIIPPGSCPSGRSNRLSSGGTRPGCRRAN
jgi:hypothetical protein